MNSTQIHSMFTGDTGLYLGGGGLLALCVAALCTLPTAWTIAFLLICILLMPAAMLLEPRAVSVDSGEVSG